MARIQHGVVQNYEQFWILSLWENGTKYWTPSIIVSKQTKIPNRKNKHNTFCTSKNIPKKIHVLYELKCFLMFFLAAKKFPFQPPLFRSFRTPRLVDVARPKTWSRSTTGRKTGGHNTGPQTNALPSRELTYPTLGKRKSSSKCHFGGICWFPGGYSFRGIHQNWA